MSLYKNASLVMIPTAYKDGKLYSIRPTDGGGDFTFSRGSNLAATRVASSGYIEKGRENLLLQSNNFNTTWVKVGYTLTSGQAGYDNTNDAWLANCTGAGNALYQTSTATGVSTFSIYVKAGTAAYARLRADQTTDAIAVINLSDGSIESESGTIKTTTTDVGGGWYRCAITWNIDTLSNVQIRPSNAAGNAITGTLYIQDAQLEAGLVATDYIETGASTAQAGILEDMPRLDYSGGASCPALLLEPQRSNFLAYSEYINGWGIKSGVTATTNSITSPDGLQNASTIAATASATNYIGEYYTFSASTKYTYSVFVKNNTSTKMRLQVYDSSQYSTLDFDQSDSVSYSANLDSYDFVDYGNGWRRVIISFTTSSGAGSGYVQIYPDRNGNNHSMYAFGAQLEAGSYPTSYIPTYGTSVTRSDDFMNISSLADEIDGNTFTYFLEVNNEAVVRDASTGNISVGASGNRFFLYNDSLTSKRLVLFIQDSSGTQSYILSADNVKLAIRFEPNNVEVFENGVSVKSTTQNLDFSADSSYVLRGTTREIGVKQTAIFPTALTDSECIALTTI